MVYDALIDDETISKEYAEQELVELSLKLSRCGREIVQGLSGSRKGRNVYVTTKEIRLKLESLQLIHKRAFVRVLTEAINSLVDICLYCPTQCIRDWKGKCYMFDMGPY